MWTSECGDVMVTPEEVNKACFNVSKRILGKCIAELGRSDTSFIQVVGEMVMGGKRTIPGRDIE